MTIDDVRIFADVTTRQAEDAFRRQMEDSDQRIEAYVRATRFRYTEKPAPRVKVIAPAGRYLV
ncbi:MAG: hypothetical protein WAL32_08550 [Terriglobales bacterium]